MNSRAESLKELFRNRIAILDGGMGTMLQRQNLTAADFGGEAYEGCNEALLLSRPEAIAQVHRAYCEAGADIIESCTFGSTPMVLGDYGLLDRAEEISQKGAALARREADAAASRDGRMRFVAGSMGPTTKSLSLTGGATFEELTEGFRLQAGGLWDGGADFLLLETQIDTLNTRASLVGVELAARERGVIMPVALSCTVEAQGVMLAGQSAEAFYASLEHVEPLYVGLNCATGPELMTDHIRTLARVARTAVSCVPNAGLPNEQGGYDETPQSLAAALGRFAEAGWLNVVGGCCGTTPDHIRAIADAVAGLKPRRPVSRRRRWITGVDLLEMDEEGRPYIVGERTNSIGSRAFRNLISDGKYAEAAEIARRQAGAGAHIIDVCLANPDRDEKADMVKFLSLAAKGTRAPFMIDSQDPEVVEAAFRLVQGKCILNSVNLEEGEDSPRFLKLVDLARCSGAMVVAGCIDDKLGMGKEPEQKLAIAKRLHQVLTAAGIPEENIMFDCLVFPCGTGDAAYLGSAAKTIEGVRLVSQEFPNCQSTLGISNVSFGLPTAGREVLNSVFLHHNVEAGLTSAIVNAEKLRRYADIPVEEKELCDNLIWNRGEDPVGRFVEHFRGQKAVVQVTTSLPPAEQVVACVLGGTRMGLEDALNALLAGGMTPLDIINGPLMEGMGEVGRRFNKNELIVAEVLQSAEAMKAAVAVLEPHLQKGDSAVRGTMLLATVKGDVHDIGKNLVEIILGNNGYRVVNLGIKVPPETLIAAAREHHPDLIGLSGLLVKSAHEMVTAAHDLREAGISAPILVGGAALSNAFTVKHIAAAYGGPVVYCRDAMGGLEAANQLTDEKTLPDYLARHRAMEAAVRGDCSASDVPPESAPAAGSGRAVLKHEGELPVPPDWNRTLWARPRREIWRYLNPVMLYGRHLGLKGVPEKLFAAKDPKALKLRALVTSLQDEVEAKGWIEPKAVFQFFPVKVDGDSLQIWNPERTAIRETLRFPRQSSGTCLSLTDFVRPGAWDSVAMFCVTSGRGVREAVESLKAKGDFLRAHALAALALETAEAYAELMHRHLRLLWGFPDAAELLPKDLFKEANYRGIRVSFGYPACPRLEDQQILFRLLRPEEIGVDLTGGFMMDPEGSVSALVFHHPEARYFAISPEDLAAFEKRLSP